MSYRKPRTFVVKGAGAFPYDMLRYDCCWPKSSEDAEALARMDRRSVTMVSVAPSLTEARWASFGWRIISHGL